MTVEGVSTAGPVVASGSGGPVEVALLARVEAAEAAVRRVEALAEQLSRSRAGWDAQVAADIRSALDGTA